MTRSGGRSHRLLVAVGVLACCLVVGFGGGQPVAAASGPAEAGVDGAGSAEEPASRSVPKLLRFSLPAVDGTVVRGASYAGKPLALWFWAPW